jgi:hypothetical protein
MLFALSVRSVIPRFSNRTAEYETAAQRWADAQARWGQVRTEIFLGRKLRIRQRPPCGRGILLNNDIKITLVAFFRIVC